MDNKLCPNTKGVNKCKEDDCCIDTYRIFDSCRYQECMENLRIYLCGDGQSVLDAAVNVRVKSVKVVWTQIRTEEIIFNRAHYDVNVRYYLYVVLECCCPDGSITEVQGIAMCEKSVVLFGGEGNLTRFQSDMQNCFCPVNECLPLGGDPCLPKVVLDVIDPVSLKLTVVDANCCTYDNPTFCLSSVPQEILNYFRNGISDCCGKKKIYITVGLFAVIRIERAAQLIIPACDYCIPQEPCEVVNNQEDPCTLFCNLDFPIREFYPSSESNAGANSFDVRTAEVNTRIR